MSLPTRYALSTPNSRVGSATRPSLTSAAEFPQELKDYIAFVEREIGVPITIISVGPDRDQTITLHPELLPQTH